MRVLMLHNRYRIRGGEDESTELEVAMLREAGHEVTLLEAFNDDIGESTGLVGAAISTIWSRDWERRISDHLAEHQVDVLHVQNFFPLISPSVYRAARLNNVAVVQSVRNYRLVCPAATLFRDGGFCNDCVSKRWKWPGIVHRCYRGSMAGSAVVASMAVVHHAMDTWAHSVDRYVAISDYVAERLVEGGFPAAKITVKPNFVPDMRAGADFLARAGRPSVLFVGRLTPEKGLDMILSAWHQVQVASDLIVVGEGERPLSVSRNVQFTGKLPKEEVYVLMRQASMVVMPGSWPEPFGRVAVEAFAQGTPVISSDIGGVASIVQHNENGLIFPAGDAQALATAMNTMLADEALRARLGSGARASYLAHYTPRANLHQLEQIYADAMAQAAISRAGPRSS